MLYLAHSSLRLLRRPAPRILAIRALFAAPGSQLQRTLRVDLARRKTHCLSYLFEEGMVDNDPPLGDSVVDDLHEGRNLDHKRQLVIFDRERPGDDIADCDTVGLVGVPSGTPRRHFLRNPGNQVRQSSLHKCE